MLKCLIFFRWFYVRIEDKKRLGTHQREEDRVKEAKDKNTSFWEGRWISVGAVLVSSLSIGILMYLYSKNISALTQSDLKDAARRIEERSPSLSPVRIPRASSRDALDFQDFIALNETEQLARAEELRLEQESFLEDSEVIEI